MAPQYLQKVEGKLQKLKEPIEQVQKTADKVEYMAAIDMEPGRLTVKLVTKKLSETVFVAIPKLLAFPALLIVLLYFLLFSSDKVAKDIVHLISRLPRQQCSLDMGYFLQREISRNLFPITTINICLGIIVAGELTIREMPNPLLWGTMVTLSNFEPILERYAVHWLLLQ